MSRKRKVLELLTRERLLEIASENELTGLTGKSKGEVVEALTASHRASFEVILSALSRDQLKEACREVGEDDSGREKQPLIDRLLGREAEETDETDDPPLPPGVPPPPVVPPVGPLQEVNPVSPRKRALGEVEDYRHDSATRKNIPPAKLAADGKVPALPKIEYSYSPRRPPVLRFDPTGAADKLPELLAEAKKRKLTDDEVRILADALRTQEPWLEWAGKREMAGFAIDPVALHIHERVSAQAILKVAARQDVERSLFADPEQEYHEAVQFYRHDIDWANRVILGDSLQAMASLAKREDLAGKVQMIYMDPPYGIRFPSNFQPEIGRRDVKDNENDLTRELEMVRAYRDTWQLGIHSYLGYLRDRLIAAREMLADKGSIFLQIGAQNVHLVRSVLDQVFGACNFVSLITVQKTTSATNLYLSGVADYVLWYARSLPHIQYRALHKLKEIEGLGAEHYKIVELEDGQRLPINSFDRTGFGAIPRGTRYLTADNMQSAAVGRDKGSRSRCES